MHGEERMDTRTSDRFIRPSEIKSVTGLSPTTVWRREKEGTFPNRRRLSPNAVGWKYSEVLAWMESCELAAEG